MVGISEDIPMYRGDDAAAEIAKAAGWIADGGRVTAFTGAGISTDSGIPDFRGPSGVWTRDPSAQRTVTLDAYVSDPAVRRTAWRNRRDHPAWAAVPNTGHRALVALADAGRLVAVITQNIDGLHQRAGLSAELVHELHGTLFEVECLGCADRTSMASALERVAAGADDPECLRCGGILKAATVSFGQALDPEVLRSAAVAAASAELLLVVGSSLTVQPAAALVGLAVEHGARLVIVNASETPYDSMADVVLREEIGIVLPRLVPAGGESPGDRPGQGR